MREGSQKAAWRERRNASVFSKSDDVPAWVCKDPNLTEAWAHDRSLTTMKTVVGYHRHFDGKLAKINEEWSLSNCSADTFWKYALEAIIKWLLSYFSFMINDYYSC